MKKNLTYSILAGLLSLLAASCSKFVDIDPPKTSLVSANVFDSEASARSAVGGIYQAMINSGDAPLSGNLSFTLLGGTSADELANASANLSYVEVATNSLRSDNTLMLSNWRNLYKWIYQTNAVIEGLESSSLAQATRNQLTGEAKFMRAFCYFYLVNAYGEVPLALSTDYQLNNSLSRTPVTGVYDQIVADLQSAQGLLSAAYTDPERIWVNRWAATALLSRVQLYRGNWSQAVAEATAVISNTALFQLEADLAKIFVRASKEVIWQLKPTIAQYNSFDGWMFLSTGVPQWGTVNSLMPGAFEAGDKRQASWIGSRVVSGVTYTFPNKYKLRFTASATTPAEEYNVMLRLGEQYLIRAEAYANLDQFTEARADLNRIRTRAGLADLTENTRAGLLSRIQQERRVELFSEMGHRWFDLKRWNLATTVLAPIKGASWQATDQLFPIPQAEIAKNGKLSQNAGY